MERGGGEAGFESEEEDRYEGDNGGGEREEDDKVEGEGGTERGRSSGIARESS